MDPFEFIQLSPRILRAVVCQTSIVGFHDVIAHNRHMSSGKNRNHAIFVIKEW